MGGVVFQALMASTAKLPIGTPTLVGQGNSTSQSGTTYSITTSAAVVVGNTVFVAVMANVNNSITTSTVTLNGVSMTKVSEAAFTNNMIVSLWYLPNAAAQSSGVTIQATFSGTTGGPNTAIIAAQATGLATASLDKSALTNVTASGTSTTVATGTLGVAQELIIGAGAIKAGTYSTPGFTNISTQAPTQTLGLDYLIVNSTASVNYTPTSSTTTTVEGAVGTFK